MSSSLNSLNNFLSPILPSPACAIINSYLGSSSETKESLRTQDSQNEAGSDESTNQVIENIWKSFVENPTQKNPILDNWIDKYSVLPASKAKRKLHSVIALIEDYIESKMGVNELDLIRAEFSRPLDILKIEALTLKMNEAVEFDAIKKINICIAKEISPQTVIEVRSLSSKDEIQNWISEHYEDIAKIQYLDLSGEELSVIPEIFSSLSIPHLSSIDLSFNNLRKLPETFGEKWPLLTQIWLNKNELQSLPAQFGINWRELSQIFLDQNRLQRLPDLFGTNWPQLTKIRLQENKLRSLPEDFGSNWPQLTGIGMCGNELQFLPAQFGVNWSELNQIFLSRNRLQLFPELFGTNWPLLKEIDLLQNNLQSLPAHFGNNWPVLHKISLRGNQLESLPTHFGSSWKAVEIIDLGNNPKLKKSNQNFGLNWPENVGGYLDPWFKVESPRRVVQSRLL